ncbi:hypothetical protein ACWEIJ_33340 [Lentzea sp. NPDC004789]
MPLTDHVLSLVAAQNETVPPGSLTEKVLLLFGGALVGFLSTYALDRIKARREPTKRLSWDASVRRALIEVSEEIKSKVRFLYEGTQVTALTHIRCTVTNTGNQLLKDQELRFPFPEGVTVLEHYLDPVPEPELDVARIKDKPAGHIRYRIGHLEPNKAVVFNFVTAGGELGQWEPHSRNPEGVDFQRRDVTGFKQDQHHLFPFFMILLLIQTLPAALNLFVLGYIGDAAASVIRVGLLIALLPHVRPLVRIVERLVTRAKDPAVRANHLIQGDIHGHVIQARSIDGNITFDDDREEPDGVHVNAIMGRVGPASGDS